jgi:hypothetical protein
MLRHKHDKEPAYLVASCDWAAANAGINTDGKPMFPRFKKHAGFTCIVIVTPESAEEGGAALIDPAPDAKSLTLYVGTTVSARRGLGARSKRLELALGPQDRAFKLMRTDPATCKAMDDVLRAP